MGQRPRAYSAVNMASPSAPPPNSTIAAIKAEVRALWPHPASEADVLAAIDRAAHDAKAQARAWFATR